MTTSVPPPSAAQVVAPPGAAWCREWTGLVDRSLRAWLDACQDGTSRKPAGIGIVALGGYARRELCPASDIDLLILHDGWPKPDLEQVVQGLCYPLWDAGLSVGYAVRTPRQAVLAAGERLETATALLEPRLVAGEGGLLDELSARIRRWVRRRQTSLAHDLVAADRRRHERRGGHPGMLEPDLKDGPGGLRDVHSLRWGASLLLGNAALDRLVDAGHLGAGERGALARAGDDLLAARCALHLARGARRPGADADVLRLQDQSDAAGLLGLDSGAILQRVNLAARTVAYLHARTWQSMVAGRGSGGWRSDGPARMVAPGVGLRDGLVVISGDVETDPALPLRAVSTAAVHGTQLARVSAIALRGKLGRPGVALPWTDAARRGLLDLLRHAGSGGGALLDADHVGLLPAYLPEWRAVRGHPQHNPWHRFDLDTHLLETVAELCRLRADPRREPFWGGLEDADAVLLAGLLHDVGKPLDGDHSEQGAVLARRWLTAMGFAPDRVARVAALVRHHLLLPDAVLHRDVDDPHELERLARVAGDVEALDGLYLLALADARATGPAVATAWRERMLDEVHRRVSRVLREGNSDGRERVLVAARTLVREPRALEGLAELVGTATRRYLTAADEAQLAAHARLLLPPPAGGTVRTALRRGPLAHTWILSVVAADRPGLIAACAGLVAAHGLEVLDAHLHTLPAGVALDWFVLQNTGGADLRAFEEALTTEGWHRLDRAADIERRRRLRGGRALARASSVPVDVRFDRDPRGTRVQVRAADVPGMLHDLVRALGDAGLDLAGARATSFDGEIRDVFFLRTGSPQIDLPELEKRLRHAAEHAVTAP